MPMVLSYHTRNTQAVRLPADQQTQLFIPILFDQIIRGESKSKKFLNAKAAKEILNALLLEILRTQRVRSIA
jgi:hypothetical protein